MNLRSRLTTVAVTAAAVVGVMIAPMAVSDSQFAALEHRVSVLEEQVNGPTPSPTPTPTPSPSPTTGDFVSNVTQPTADNTGPGTDGRTSTLTVINGDFHPKSNTTYRDIDVTGRIVIDKGVSNVTVDNCRVQGRTVTSGDGKNVIDTGAGHNTTIAFCEIYAASGWGGANGIGNKNFTIIRSDIHNVTDGIRVNRVPTSNSNDPGFASIRDSYIHDLFMLTPDPAHRRSDNKTHSDGIEIEGADGLTVTGNSIQAYHSTDGTSNVSRTTSSYPYTPVSSGGIEYKVTTSAIMFADNTPPISDVLIQHNWLGGGEVTVNHRDEGTGKIIDNIFDRGALQKVAIYPKTSSKFTISGNVYTDGSKV